MINRANITLVALIALVGWGIGILYSQDPPPIKGYASFICKLPNPSFGHPQRMRLQDGGVLIVEPEQKIDLAVDFVFSKKGIKNPRFNFPVKWTSFGGKASTDSHGVHAFNLISPKEPGLYEMKAFYIIGDEEGRDEFTICVMQEAKPIYQKRPSTYAYPLTVGNNIPDRIKQNRKSYQPPKYMFQMSEDLGNAFVLPGYRLKEFVCTQNPDDTSYAAYAYIDNRLIDKIRQLTIALIQNNYIKRKIKIISGYRTPSFNRDERIAGSTYSRHLYGDAISFIIDENNDGRMDDVNSDGKVDRKDGELIARLIRKLENAGKVAFGGTGIYEYDASHPFVATVHMDTRGRTVTWGYSITGEGQKKFYWDNVSVKKPLPTKSSKNRKK